MKTNRRSINGSAGVSCIAVLLIVALWFGGMMGMAWVLRFVLAGVFHYHLAYWYCFAIWFLLSALFAAGKSSGGKS